MSKDEHEVGPATAAQLRRDFARMDRVARVRVGGGPDAPVTQGASGASRVDEDGYEREETDGGTTGTAVGRRRQYHTSLEAGVVAELDELARAAGLSRAAMIRVAVVDGLPLVRARFRAVR